MRSTVKANYSDNLIICFECFEAGNFLQTTLRIFNFISAQVTFFVRICPAIHESVHRAKALNLHLNSHIF